jgi:hypothetical protein
MAEYCEKCRMTLSFEHDEIEDIMYKVCKKCNETRIPVSEETRITVSTTTFRIVDESAIYRIRDPHVIFDLTLPRISATCISQQCILSVFPSLLGRTDFRALLFNFIPNAQAHDALSKSCSAIASCSYYPMFVHHAFVLFREEGTGLADLQQRADTLCRQYPMYRVSPVTSLPADKVDAERLLFEEGCLCTLTAEVVAWRIDRETKTFVFMCTVCGKHHTKPL